MRCGLPSPSPAGIAGAWLCLLLGAFGSGVAAADAAASENAAAEAGMAAADDRESAREEIMSAYRKEYAFLVAQKRELERRLERFGAEADEERAALETRLDDLADEVAALEADGESLQERIRATERRREAAESNADALRATFQQAGATFSEYDLDFMDADGFAERAEAERLAGVFRRGQELLGELASVRREEGAFHTHDGARVEGTLIRVGDIAVYGVADEAAGALAPAGGGALRVWEEPASDDARALAQGRTPDVLSLFLYEALDTEVEGRGDAGLIEKIDSGGIIGWMIVGLGGFAGLLILARVVFLQRASASTNRIVRRVGEKVRARDLDGALEICRQLKGSTAAVVAAALRNVEREREQLEDIVNEAILHESSHLERFGSVILVIAAVSPLLGLLGTVTGMISTFDVITEFGTGDPKLLSGGISIALVTTEFGLIVAIPTLLIGNVLSGWAERIKDDMQKAALRVTNIHWEAVRASSVAAE